MKSKIIIYCIAGVWLSGCASTKNYQLNQSQGSYVEGFKLSRDTRVHPPVIQAGASLRVSVDVEDADASIRGTAPENIKLNLVTLQSEYVYGLGRNLFSFSRDSCNISDSEQSEYRNNIEGGKKFLVYLAPYRYTQGRDCYTEKPRESRTVTISGRKQDIQIAVPSVIETDTAWEAELASGGVAVKVWPKKIEYYFAVENGVATIKAISDDGPITDIRAITIKRTIVKNETRLQEIASQKEKSAADEKRAQDEKKLFLQMQKKKCPPIIQHVILNGGNRQNALAGVMNGTSFMGKGVFFASPDMTLTYINYSCGAWWAAHE